MFTMKRLLLSMGIAAGAALFMAAPPARAAVGSGVVITAPDVAAATAVTPVYWVWHGRHWGHRRWYARRYYGGRWVPGYYRYY